MGATKRSWQAALAALTLAAASVASANPVGASFTGYTGPVGDFFNCIGCDPEHSTSMFRLDNGTASATFPVEPTTLLGGTAHVGTATHDFTEVSGANAVAFWNDAEATLATANVLSFTAVADVPPIPFVPFVLGTLSVTNGSWFSSDPQIAFIPGIPGLTFYDVSVFHFEAHVVGLAGASWVDDLIYVATRGAGTDDFFSFRNHPEMGTFAAPEGVTSSVDILAQIGSLDPIRFVNPQGGGSIIAAAPEPATSALLAIALLAASLRARRRR